MSGVEPRMLWKPPFSKGEPEPGLLICMRWALPTQTPTSVTSRRVALDKQVKLIKKMGNPQTNFHRLVGSQAGLSEPSLPKAQLQHNQSLCSPAALEVPLWCQASA